MPQHQQPISTTRFDLPGGLAPFSAPLRQFHDSYDPAARLVVGAYVFTVAAPPTPPTTSSAPLTTSTTAMNDLSALSNPTPPALEPTPRLLVLHRAAQDFFGNHWDIPGGSVEPSHDSTLLGAVSREVFEETGLHVRRVREFVGWDTWEDVRRNGERVKWTKFGFWVDVEEGADGEDGKEGGKGRPEVKLAPDEHQAFRWVGREVLDKALDGMQGMGKAEEGEVLRFISVEEVEIAREAFRRFERSLNEDRRDVKSEL